MKTALNTARILTGLGQVQAAVRGGFHTVQFGCLVPAPTKWVKRCGRSARIFWSWFESNQTKTRIAPYEARGERPDTAMCTIRLPMSGPDSFLFGNHQQWNTCIPTTAPGSPGVACCISHGFCTNIILNPYPRHRMRHQRYNVMSTQRLHHWPHNP